MPARYRIERKIADGGMAEIFLATQHGAEGFERKVVLKRILAALLADPKFRNMMIDEAHVAMGLNHSNIVQVLDLGQSMGRYFLVLELVDGWDLNHILNRLKETDVAMPPELALYIVAEVCRALGYAHARTRDGKALGIVHRDISPHNVLISEQGEVKLTDFGIAKALGRRERTGQGIIKGKLAFMSPEQASGAPLDARSDLFSVGTMLYLMVTGKRPFDAPTDLEIILRVQHGKFTPPLEVKPDLALEIGRIIEKSLKLTPSERYQTAEELLVDLEAAQRTIYKPAGQTELKRWLADLGRRVGMLPVSRAQPLPTEAEDEEVDLIEGVDIVFEQVVKDKAGPNGGARAAGSSAKAGGAMTPPPVPDDALPRTISDVPSGSDTIADKPFTGVSQIVRSLQAPPPPAPVPVPLPVHEPPLQPPVTRRRWGLLFVLGSGAAIAVAYFKLFRRQDGNDSSTAPGGDPTGRVEGQASQSGAPVQPTASEPATPGATTADPTPAAAATPAPDAAPTAVATPASEELVPTPSSAAGTAATEVTPGTAVASSPGGIDARPAGVASLPPPDAAPPATAAAEDDTEDEETLLKQQEPDVADKVIGEEDAPRPASRTVVPPRRPSASARPTPSPPPPPPTPAREAVLVRIESRPDGAVVSIRGSAKRRVLGRAPLNLRFNSGILYEVSFVKSGYQSVTKRFTVSRRKNQRVVGYLPKKKSSPQRSPTSPQRRKGLLQRIFGG